MRSSMLVDFLLMRCEMSDTVCLIDGKNFLYRNHYAHRTLTTSEGEPTGVLYGCLMGLLSLASKLPEVPIALVWDGRGPTWRHKLLKPLPKKDVVRKPETWLDTRVQGSLNYLNQKRPAIPVKEKIEGYKATRDLFHVKRDDSRAEALSQLPELLRILKLIGVQSFEVDGLEGDDLMGILMSEILKWGLFKEVIIHSTDNDFYQLLQYEGLKILRGLTMDGELMWVDDKDVYLEHGVKVEEWVSYRALVGDKTDNIPQVRKGLGPVKCKALLRMGFDPALSSDPDSNLISEKAWNCLMEYCRERVDRTEIWQHVRKSYIASKIVTGVNFKLFSDDVKRNLNKLVSELKRESFLRKPYSEEGYRELSEWLVRKEMLQLKGRVQEFNSLC